MYLGESQTVLDDKGRITIPRRIRETMSVMGHIQWFMTRGYDQSIFMFPHDEWEKILSQAGKYSSMNAQAIDFRRMFFGSVAEAQPDRQGRMPIAAHLREYAKLDKEVVLIGVGERLELWNRELWRAFQADNQADFKEKASALFAGGEVAALSESEVANQ